MINLDKLIKHVSGNTSFWSIVNESLVNESVEELALVA